MDCFVAMLLAMTAKTDAPITQKSLAPKNSFSEADQADAICPDGRAKINRFAARANQTYLVDHPVSIEGRSRDRHERETGCGGRRRR
jgi:hypothetical protein